jgi:hypothetical protein
VDGSALTPNACTIASVAGCGSNVETVPDDPDCKCAVPYKAAASLHRPPSNWLAMLFGVGAVGLLLPSRKRPL